MICEKCGKNIATTHIKTIVNGLVTEKNLCAYCAASEGYSGTVQTNLADVLASMFGEMIETPPMDTVKCPVCGSTFSDIAQSGKVGCSECYRCFGSELLPYLKRVHGSIKHIGKIPNDAPLAVVPEAETIESLKMKLNRLVSEEKYEQAAVIRDKIKKLEGEKDE